MLVCLAAGWDAPEVRLRAAAEAVLTELACLRVARADRERRSG